jgi:hypothetical protein
MRLRPLLAAALLAACNAPPSPEFPSEGVATAEGTRLLSSTPADRESIAEKLAGQPPLLLTHGAVSRAHEQELEARLEAILSVVQPEIEALQAELAGALAGLVRPERLATTDPVLRTWRQSARKAYQDSVELFHDEAERRLSALRDYAMGLAADQARALAPARSPLDPGPSGEAALDGALETFSEVLDGAVNLSELSVHRSQDLERRVDLFEAFSTFGEDAEAAMGGRIHLFLGGDETDGVPRALLAFRVDDGRAPGSLHVRQVLRHRILRGAAIVQDLGWRAAPMPDGPPGRPVTEVLGTVLVAPRIEPVVDRSAPAYDQLRDMRVQCDVQSAVYQGDRLLGGVDWRVEFQVSARGDLTWQVAGGKPVFDAHCAEVVRVLGG